LIRLIFQETWLIIRPLASLLIMADDEASSNRPRPNAAFTTTHWSVVLEAARGDSSQAAEALAQLCRTYWYPLYAYVRRKGYDPHDAEDLTQEFFLRLLEKKYLTVVDRNKGKFRSFLLKSFNHFLHKEWRDAHTHKRGGRLQFLSLDDAAEQRYLLELTHDMTAERLFDRRWAMTVLDTVMERLREECAASGKAQLFDHLKGALSGDKSQPGYAEVGASLNMTEGAVKTAMHRLRQRYAELLRAEVANTVASQEQVEEELRELIAALGG
jgi:RNA polymerase sigma-70 factor (ECF subfamily)